MWNKIKGFFSTLLIQSTAHCIKVYVHMIYIHSDSHFFQLYTCARTKRVPVFTYSRFAHRFLKVHIFFHIDIRTAYNEFWSHKSLENGFECNEREREKWADIIDLRNKKSYWTHVSILNNLFLVSMQFFLLCAVERSFVDTWLYNTTLSQRQLNCELDEEEKKKKKKIGCGQRSCSSAPQ